jgi:hypothetical protein
MRDVIKSTLERNIVLTARGRALEQQGREWSTAWCARKGNKNREITEADFDLEAQAIRDELDSIRAELDRNTNVLVEAMVVSIPQPGSNPAVWEYYHPTLWQSTCQGSKYAQAAAQMDADRASLMGIPAVVVQINQWTPDMSDYYSTYRKGEMATPCWACVVDVEDPQVDLELLKHSPAPSLVEQVRLCWARGVNPRVYNPFLPYDFEEKHGISYTGTVLSMRHA